MRRLLVPLVLLGLTVAGCSGDKKDAEPRATFSPPTVETETPTPTPSPTPSPTPTFPKPDCAFATTAPPPRSGWTG